MAKVSKTMLQSFYKNVPINIEVVKEAEHSYSGAGTGLFIII
jgi:hypothetical protein